MFFYKIKGIGDGKTLAVPFNKGCAYRSSYCLEVLSKTCLIIEITTLGWINFVLHFDSFGEIDVK